MSKPKTALGKGLGALIPSVTEATDKPVSVRPTKESLDDGTSTGVLAHIDVRKIRPNPYQPRMEFDPATLAELAQSIRRKGVIQPITVRRHREGEYELISGERRVRACIEAGVAFIPAYIIRISSREEMLELALIENIQRERLNPIEIASSYQRLVEECGYTQEEIADRVGKDRTTVANFIRLLRLPDQIQKSLIKNEISMGHARALINLPQQKEQLRIWQKIMKNRLSVRNVERLVQKAAGADAARKNGSRRSIPIPAQASVEEILAELKTRYGTRVLVHTSRKGKGSIELEFYSSEDFERILELLLHRK